MRCTFVRAVTLGLIIAVTGTATAGASVVQVDGTFLFLTESSPEDNSISVGVDGTDVVFTETKAAGPPVVAGEDCVQRSTRVAACSQLAQGGVRGFRMFMGDLDDELSFDASYQWTMTTRIEGGAGDDDLGGSPARDVMVGDGGDDTLAGGADDDLLEGGDGADTLSGGTNTAGGGDTATYQDRDAGVRVTLDTVANDGGGCDVQATCEGDNVGGANNDVEDIVGGFGGDRLSGQQTVTPPNLPVDNELRGGDGNDQLTGYDGNDLLDGNEGDDDLRGGRGDDGLIGDGGIDPFQDPGADVADYTDRSEDVTVDLEVSGGPGTGGATGTTENDHIGSDVENARGGAGDDTLTGDERGNVLEGVAGDDVLRGGEEPAGFADDAFRGGDGVDEVLYDDRARGVTVTTGDGQANDGAGATPQDSSSEQDDVGSDVENVGGGSGDDVLSGANDVANQLRGNGGADTLDGLTGADVLHGGSGTDRVTYASRGGAGGVSVTLNLGADDGALGEGDVVGGPTEDARIEDATGSGQADTLTGDAGANALDGAGGDDTLRGRAGPDLLTGAGGADTADYSQDGRTAGVNVDVDGGANDGDTSDCSQACTEGDDSVDTENLRGTSGADDLSGDANANRIEGLDGDDAIDGEGQGDVLSGGDDDDVIEGGSGDDTLDGGLDDDDLRGGTDFDTVSYAGRTTPVAAAIGTTSANGETGEADGLGGDVEGLVGGSADDRLVGDGDPNSLDGRGGGDLLHGGPGTAPDLLLGGSGVDTASYGRIPATGTEVVGARNEALTITLDGQANDGATGESDAIDATVENAVTGSGPDTVTGNGGVNRFETGEGDDTVVVRDSVQDTADCGGGSDTASADASDSLTACETVNLTDPVTGGGNGGTDTTGGGGSGSGSGSDSGSGTAITTTTPTQPTPFAAPPSGPDRSVLSGPLRQPTAVSAVVGPRRDRRAPYRFTVRGQVGLPTALVPFRQEVCGEGGLVSVQTEVGRRTVSTRRVRIDSACGYRATVSFRDARRVLRGRSAGALRMTARFLGNRYLGPRAGRPAVARVG